MHSKSYTKIPDYKHNGILKERASFCTMVGLLVLCLVSGRVKRALISSHCTSWAVLISGSGPFDPILNFKETGTRYVPMRWIDREVARFMSSEALLPRWANQEEGVVGGVIWPPLQPLWSAWAQHVIPVSDFTDLWKTQMMFEKGKAPFFQTIFLFSCGYSFCLAYYGWFAFIFCLINCPVNLFRGLKNRNNRYKEKSKWGNTLFTEQRLLVPHTFLS